MGGKDSSQKQTGAYYTTEDITDYITKNTLLPHLFEAARKECPGVFAPGSLLWQSLADQPERYLYPSLRHGVLDEKGRVLTLPTEIERGLDAVDQRDGWNQPAAPNYALPNETWREYIARRRRSLALRERLARGEVSRIDDLVTHNLDIRRFALDTIASCEAPDLLRAFHRAISTVTVLDPTCGSGAFLLAALNVLRPLYAACLDRMQVLLDNPSRSASKLRDFRLLLAEATRPPGPDSFIVRSIIRNLYGVDIMKEVVEVCKLRLLLEHGAPLEPLPDLELNIRAGNALVGFQWAAEFPGIMRQGGFDVILGNPPYLEKARLGSLYSVRGYETAGCRDIYAWCVERATQLLGSGGRLGLIVPVSVVSSESFAPLRRVLRQGMQRLWLSHFANRPGQLFSGGQNRLTIVLRSPSELPGVFSTRYHRWDAQSGERERLFECLGYIELPASICSFHGLLPKVGEAEAVCVLEKLLQARPVADVLVPWSDYPIYWVRVPGYFCQFFLRPPLARPEAGGERRPRGEVNAIYCPDEATQRSLHAILNSSTWYQFFTAFSDGRHVNPYDVKAFPCDLRRLPPAAQARLGKLSERLEASMRAHTSWRRKSGLLVESVDSRPAKPLLDQIDAVLARQHGFSAEVLDFLRNHDVKYRMGQRNRREGG